MKGHCSLSDLVKDLDCSRFFINKADLHCFIGMSRSSVIGRGSRDFFYRVSFWTNLSDLFCHDLPALHSFIVIQVLSSGEQTSNMFSAVTPSSPASTGI